LELVTKKHNDTEWCPQSQPVFGFHTRLKVSHLLPQDVQKLYTSMKGTFNKMISNYSTSGNGSLNLQELHTHCDNKYSKSSNDSHEEVFVDNNDKKILSWQGEPWLFLGIGRNESTSKYS
jgi:hypothetical protein